MLALLVISASALVQGPVLSQVTARRGFVAQAVAGVAASAFVGVAPSRAGYLTNLGFGDAAPSAAEIDKEVLASGAVQTDLKKIAKYAAMATALNVEFTANGQADIKPAVAAFNRAELRTSMNTVNAIFSEEYQKQSDRIIRNVIQDLSELDSLITLKGDGVRTAKKIKSIARFVSKLDTDLNLFIASATA
ncbi:hypothetical protein T492DRAFT_1082861 [Pavlovales sp. CCMP2436]|nr:hypothetical protein T492DRAFT_1082861 [Pavlovales sp. CCMP2436]